MRKVKVVNFFLCVFVISFLAGCEKNSEFRTQNRTVAVQDKNSAPVAHSILKNVLKNSSFFLDLSSLSLDVDGDVLEYMIIEQLPKHGSLSVIAPDLLIFPDVDNVYYTYARGADPSCKKFDGRFLRIKYTPDKDFVGTDSFNYLVFNAKGAKSNIGIVTISMSNLPIITENHPPEVYDLAITTAVKVPVYIDLRSLTFDADGDSLQFATDTEGGLKETSHGVREFVEWINYLPRTVGTDIINYNVWDKDYNERKTGTITITITEGEGIAYSQRNRSGGLKGFKNYLDLLPLSKQITMIIAHMFFYLVSAGVLILLLHVIMPRFQFSRKFLVCSGAVLFVIGVSLLMKVVVKSYYVKFAAVSIISIIGGIYCFFPPKTTINKDTPFVRFLQKYFSLIILFVLNALILVYHFNSISLPAVTLDSQSYISLYNFFKYGIRGYTNMDHYQRVLVPYLASLIPLDNPVLAFKILNIIFVNSTTILLCMLWRKLNIKYYLILIAFLWLFLHQFGPIRFYNFWPTSIDVPSYFFYSLLIYVIFKNKYKWLLLICPIAALQREGVFLDIFGLLFYKIVSYYFLDKRTVENKNALKFIFSSIVLSVLALRLPGFINPQISPLGYSLARIIGRLRVYLGLDIIMLPKLFIFYFVCYGGFLLLFLGVVRKAYQKTDLFNMLIIFSIINFLVGLGGVGSRGIFLGYPFIMTVILITLNRVNPILVVLSLLLSLPLMKIYIDFPFTEYPLLYDAPIGYLAILGIYMVILYWILNYLNDSKALDSVMKVIKKQS